MPGSSSTSLSLIERVRQRDQDGWTLLVRIYEPSVERWCRIAQLQDADVRDVTQEVFEAVGTHIESFRRTGGQGSFRAWLKTIFRSKLVDCLRKQARQPVSYDAGALDRYADEVVSRCDEQRSRVEEQRAALHRALEAIRPDFRPTTWAAFWRSTIENESTGSIAADLEMTSAAVCMARSRVLRRLRETVEGLDLCPNPRRSADVSDFDGEAATD